MRTFLVISAFVATALAAGVWIGSRVPAPLSEAARDPIVEPATFADAPTPLATCPDRLPATYADDARSRGSIVVVYKSLYLLGVYDDGKLALDRGEPVCVPVSMGMKPWGGKTEMDNKSTPEGWYRTATKQDKGQTSFYRAFRISYPNADDVRRALSERVIDAPTERRLLADIVSGRSPSQNTAMGGDIMVHGVGAWVPFWTAGCVAVENETMDLLFRRVVVGETVLITPWTERYALAPDGSLVVSTVPMPVGIDAEITIPFTSIRTGWQPGVRFARMKWMEDGSVSVQPIVAPP